ncbi:MAG: SH3 domain-containing protein [Gemmatimonadales bacterium]
MRRVVWQGARALWPALAPAVLLSACSGGQPRLAPEPAPRDSVVVVLDTVRDTVTIRDPDQEQKMARLQVQLLERDAQIEELRGRVDEARREVVRAMAKLQTLASRAEAASGMAEAEVALRSLKAATGQQAVPEAAQAGQLLQLGSAEFDKQNYGGALYLANQAKGLASAGRERLAGGDRGPLRSGEVLFAVPVPLQVQGRCNVRAGPGTGFKILFTLDPGARLTGYSSADAWVRVSDEGGRSGWVFYNLVDHREDTGK